VSSVAAAQLYDLDADLGERVNLNETQPDVLAEMEARFWAWSADIQFSRTNEVTCAQRACGGRDRSGGRREGASGADGLKEEEGRARRARSEARARCARQRERATRDDATKARAERGARWVCASGGAGGAGDATSTPRSAVGVCVEGSGAG
jgi:hypothetical protein